MSVHFVHYYDLRHIIVVRNHKSDFGFPEFPTLSVDLKMVGRKTLKMLGHFVVNFPYNFRSFAKRGSLSTIYHSMQICPISKQKVLPINRCWPTNSTSLLWNIWTLEINSTFAPLHLNFIFSNAPPTINYNIICTTLNFTLHFIYAPLYYTLPTPTL